MGTFQDSNVVIACASTQSSEHFYRSTLLGRSLQTFPDELRPSLALLPRNKGPNAVGLSEFYNRIIDLADSATIIVFCHDDVYLHDWNLVNSLKSGLSRYDVLGIVGSSNVPWGQPGWWFTLGKDGLPERNDHVIKSGSVNHFDYSQIKPDVYGISPAQCDLLDGFFLASHSAKLHSSGLRFDPTFRFHCYDTDFCYTARSLGLTIGTWPIPCTHGSPGSFEESWGASATALITKLNSSQL